MTAAILGSVALLHVEGETGGEVDAGGGVGLGVGVVSTESFPTSTEVGVAVEESSSDAFICKG